MFDSTRRAFLHRSALGLATIGASGLILRGDAQPTQEVSRTDADRILIQMVPTKGDPVTPKGELKKITPITYGPFYRPGAPFRGKLSVPGEPGTTFILSGRVWAYDSKRPLPGAVLDLWHVDHNEKYSNGTSDLRNRGRVISSETGYYEVESIRPIPYRPDPTGSPEFWRCAHFHLAVFCPGYQPLVTEIHFQNDPKRSDPMFRVENAMAIEARPSTARSSKPEFSTSCWNVRMLPSEKRVRAIVHTCVFHCAHRCCEKRLATSKSPRYYPIKGWYKHCDK